jgi:ribosomal protein S18 acetylase RimI-like enzyme
MMKRLLPRPDEHQVLVAEGPDGSVVGWARSSRFIPPEDAPAGCAPEGWYLLGLAVDREWRRQGLGQRLSLLRLDWLSKRAERVLYFTTPHNGPSIALHRKLGFELIQHDCWFPGAIDGDGAGFLLFQRDLD